MTDLDRLAALAARLGEPMKADVEWRIPSSVRDSTVIVRSVAAGRVTVRWTGEDGLGRAVEVPAADAAEIVTTAARPGSASDDDWASVSCHSNELVREIAALSPHAPDRHRAAAVLAGVPDRAALGAASAEALMQRMAARRQVQLVDERVAEIAEESSLPRRRSIRTSAALRAAVAVCAASAAVLLLL